MMATYKYAQYLAQTNHAAFDTISTPGTAAPYSGIYRCEGCASEVASNEGQPLPPQNAHQHESHHGSIRWRLIVYADHQKK
jgi:hypothetical protein